jgi:hypothetical protein
MSQDRQDAGPDGIASVEAPQLWLSASDMSNAISSPKGYAVLGEATSEELALVRIFGIALILMLIIVGMALSQYVVCFFACTGSSSL